MCVDPVFDAPEDISVASGLGSFRKFCGRQYGRGLTKIELSSKETHLLEMLYAAQAV